MERERVTSSNIESIGYDNSKQILEVEFRGGGVYQYKNVPEEVYKAFVTSESVGKFFHSSIKKMYEFEPVFKKPIEKEPNVTEEVTKNELPKMPS